MRFLNVLLSCALLLFISALPLAAQEGPPVPTSLKTLKAAHPRLMILDSDLPAIKARIASDPFAKSRYNAMFAESESLLSVRPSVYVLDDRGTLLWPARIVEHRILTLAGMYRLTGDRRFADRAITEMLAAASFPDWDIRHPLSTGEMTAALGIGYDWLYPVLTPEKRETIKLAIIEKGISPFMNILSHNRFHMLNNWSQVIYGGETVGALAIADDDTSKAIAQKMIGYARPGITAVMKLFAPDGGFEEGPVYWNYATISNVLYIASLDSALGTDFGASKMPGFEQTPQYELQANDPLYLYANFGDAHIDAYSASPQMFWFARRFHQPLDAVHERNLEIHLQKRIDAMEPYRGLARFEMMGLLWYALAPEPSSAKPLPLVEDFSRIDQAYMRTAWSDPDAWYVAFKGGKNGVSHSHLDLGSFVLDALGQRWAIDLGPDTYGLPGYFAKQRWNYYRTQTRSHNTIAIGDENQDPHGTAKLLFVEGRGNDKFAVLDLNDAYTGKVQSWKRGVAILDNRRVLVQDEISPAKADNLIWHLHTRATVAIASDGRSVTLNQGGKTLQATIVSPAGVRFSILPEHISPAETPNPGVTDLVIDIPGADQPRTIAVVFSRNGEGQSVRLRDLKEWKNNE
jgi:hypothetical protein